MYQQLIETTQKRKELEMLLAEKRREFESSIAIEKATLDDLLAKENELREAVLLIMKKDKKEVETIGENSIHLSAKVTRKIDNVIALMSSIKYNQDDICNLLEDKDIDIDDFISNNFEAEYKVVDKKGVIDLVNKFESVQGKLLPGVVDQVTEYLTVK